MVLQQITVKTTQYQIMWVVKMQGPFCMAVLIYLLWLSTYTQSSKELSFVYLLLLSLTFTNHFISYDFVWGLERNPNNSVSLWYDTMTI